MLKLFTAAILSIPFLAHAETDQQCMATAVYVEARGESIVGQRAVYDVIMNRVKASGKSVCNVIKAAGQFPWWVDGMKMMAYNSKMKQFLKEVEDTGAVLISENYTFFFTKNLRPAWAKNLHCAIIEGHKFCGVKG